MKKNKDIRNFDISEHLVEDKELSLFEESLADCVAYFKEKGKDPYKDTKLLRQNADELMATALSPIPCWDKVKLGPYAFENGLHKTPTGTALIHNGYFVMVEDLVERLPRIAEHD